MAASFIAVVILVVLLILLRNRFSQKKGEEQKVYETKIYNFIRDNNITDDMYFSNVLENEGGPDINYAKVIALNKTESVIEIVVFPTYQKWQVEKREEPIIQKVAFADIIEVRALSNSRIIVSTIKGSQFGRKNSRFSNERILNNSSKRLTLEIVVNSKSNSVIEIPFYDSKVWELVAGVEKHEKIARDLKYWYREISEILDPNNSYSNQEYAEEDESPGLISVYDENNYVIKVAYRWQDVVKWLELLHGDIETDLVVSDKERKYCINGVWYTAVC